MDLRWHPFNRDSQKDVRVILHPTADIAEVRRGQETASDDSIDLSPYVTQGTQSAFDVSVTLNFNRELFGATQPKPNQILEIQLWQDEEFRPCWIGVIEAINSFTLQRGERSMQLTAKTRDSQDVWRNTKRVTPLYPQMTDLTYIIFRIAMAAGMKHDEIVLPRSAYTTAHSNTQLAEMNAWDMVEAVALACGWKPFIDVLGRLRMADRTLIGRQPDVVVPDASLIRVGGQRQRSSRTRVRVLWLNPLMTKHIDQGQLLNSYDITLGWFLPYWKKTVYFSDDKTQRAVNTWMRSNPSANKFGWPPFVQDGPDRYRQQTEVQGKIHLINWSFAAMPPLLYLWIKSVRERTDHVTGAFEVPPTGGLVSIPEAGPLNTVPSPNGSLKESIMLGIFMYLMIKVGTGTYEIWGQPFHWAHARNISEAFDESVPTWVDNAVEIECDFIQNEEHAKQTAIRELIYQAKEQNKWNVTIVDDPRIEVGSILQFTDGTQLYVEDFNRKLERGSEATLDVQGFYIGLVRGIGKTIAGGTPPLPGEVTGGQLPPGTGEPPPTSFVWAWKPMPGSPAVDSPYGDGPQDEAAYKTYFFGLIGKAEGDPANDWEAVLTDSGIPNGLDVGVVPTDSMPFYALTQQIGAGGVRGRLFLPTSTADGLGYYSFPVDLLNGA